MSNLGILSWQNEAGLVNYPLSVPIGIMNFVIDANFIQFDNFIPTLDKIEVFTDRIELTIACDTEIVVVTILKSGFLDGKVSKVYATNGRYMGKLIIGGGANTLWDNFSNRTIDAASPFVSSVVQSISTAAGVYSIDNVLGDVEMALDNNMFVGQTGQQLILNAVGLDTTSAAVVLKTINGVVPIKNNIYIEDSDIMKIGTTANTTITINTVVADLTSVSSILPSS